MLADWMGFQAMLVRCCDTGAKQTSHMVSSDQVKSNNF